MQKTCKYVYITETVHFTIAVLSGICFLFHGCWKRVNPSKLWTTATTPIQSARNLSLIQSSEIFSHLFPDIFLYLQACEFLHLLTKRTAILHQKEKPCWFPLPNIHQNIAFTLCIKVISGIIFLHTIWSGSISFFFFNFGSEKTRSGNLDILKPFSYSSNQACLRHCGRKQFLNR